MNGLKLSVKRIDGGMVPHWTTIDDAGLDLHSNEEVTVFPKQIQLVKLGIATEFSSTFVALLRDRSGLGLQGLHVLAGVIDSSYRGEWKAVFCNLGSEPILIKRFDRVCQAIFVPRVHMAIVETDILTDSLRGASGFGASGT